MHDERFVLQGLLLAHGAMRRDARRLAAACAAACRDDDLRALGRWLTQLRTHLDEHHGADDDLFVPMLRALDREALIVHTAALAALFDRPLAAEEALVVAATIALVSPDEQRALEAELQRRAPISGVAFLLPWVLSSLPAPEADALLRELPLPMRFLQHLLWRRSYARLAEPLALADRADDAEPDRGDRAS